MPQWLGRLAYPDYPAVARVWTSQQYLNYNAALDLMKQPPAGVRLRVFRPLKPLPVGSLTVGVSRIRAAVAAGYEEALTQVTTSTLK
jgi:predicted patatin/cPLA2 family phospholipase